MAANGVSGASAVAGAAERSEGSAHPEIGADFVCVQRSQRGEGMAKILGLLGFHFAPLVVGSASDRTGVLGRRRGLILSSRC